MSNPASQSLIESYRRDGFVVVDGLINDEILSDLEAKFFRQQYSANDVIARYQSGGQVDWKKVRNLAEKDDSFFALATLPEVVNIVEVLIGDEPLLFRDVMVVKPKKHGARLSYHQDSEFWDIVPSDLVSVWIPFQDTTVSNGCLKVIPGSHKKRYAHDLYVSSGRRLPPWMTVLLRRGASLSGTGDSDQSGLTFFRRIKNFVLGTMTKIFPFLGRLQELVARVEEADYVREMDIPVRRTSAVFFHGRLLHASNPNTSTSDRLAFIPSYMGSRFRFNGVGKLSCLRARNHGEREYVAVTNASED